MWRKWLKAAAWTLAFLLSAGGHLITPSRSTTRLGQSPQNVPQGSPETSLCSDCARNFCILHSSFCLLHFPSPAHRNCGHSGSRGDCRLEEATQERRLQAADGLHNPANRLTTPERRRLRFDSAD